MQRFVASKTGSLAEKKFIRIHRELLKLSAKFVRLLLYPAKRQTFLSKIPRSASYCGSPSPRGQMSRSLGYMAVHKMKSGYKTQVLWLGSKFATTVTHSTRPKKNLPPFPFGRICFVVLVMRKEGESS